MCGILGAICYDDEQRFRDALDLMHHRGPDNTGIYRADPHVLLGHKRLAIIDLDEKANQPFVDSGGKHVMVFNGEIYNYLDIKKELQGLGVVFRTESDTEVLLKAYLQWQENAFIKLHGMFAFAIYDLEQKKMVLGRDRMGEKPLFYTKSGNRFFFASELKSICRLLSDRPVVDLKALLDYLSFGYVPTPKTIYSGIRKLEPGSYLNIDVKTLETAQKPYYTARFENSIKDPVQAAEMFDQILSDVSKEITLSDVGYGVFLSGGVDSSGVAAYISRNNSRVNAYTIGFNDAQFDESPYATQVARHLDLTHHILTLDADNLIDIYEQMVDLYDEPFNDFSFIPSYFVAHQARQFQKVIVSGDGADEIFSGYQKYPRLKRLTAVYPFRPVCKMAGALSMLLPESSDYKRQLHRVGLSQTELLFDMMAIVYKRRELAKILGPALKPVHLQYSSGTIIENHINDLPADTSLLQKLRYLDVKMRLVDAMLVKVDRASMANSLEVRAFYLHPRITDFSFQLDDTLLVRDKTAKFILKKTLENRLPDPILYRPKMGFSIPLKKWITKDLKPVFDEAVGNLPDELFDKQAIDAVVRLHEKSQRDFILQLHALMFLGTWLKRRNISFS